MKSITELWAPVLLNGGIFKDTYVVSNMGRVKQKRCYKNGSCQYVLVRIINGKRPMVKMIGNGKKYSKSVAKLVLSSFQYREGCECAHVTYLDGNMKNCALSNLRYTADAGVYTSLEKKDKINIRMKKTVKSPKIIKPKASSVIKRSCSTCQKEDCFKEMAKFSSDFGAEGCRGYRPKLMY